MRALKYDKTRKHKKQVAHQPCDLTPPATHHEQGLESKRGDVPAPFVVNVGCLPHAVESANSLKEEQKKRSKENIGKTGGKDTRQSEFREEKTAKSASSSLSWHSAAATTAAAEKQHRKKRVTTRVTPNSYPLPLFSPLSCSFDSPISFKLSVPHPPPAPPSSSTLFLSSAQVRHALKHVVPHLQSHEQTS